jgi:hypothetical protein
VTNGSLKTITDDCKFNVFASSLITVD